ncbi:hypothetical protein QQF64_020062 [Cirrhinus molitorella]|uniref:P2X purinoreceptor 7 intracellular domain-containing protein n=1 Tax=Cirrhinus molitorella TaxID=172907 RepID=A0ABR3LJR8_9TELE
MTKVDELEGRSRRQNLQIIGIPEGLEGAQVEEVVQVHPPVWGEEWVGNNSWCKCGWCTPIPTVSESICCQEADLDHALRGHSCITMVRTFNILCREVDVLEVAMLSLKDVRAETLERPVNSR